MNTAQNTVSIRPFVSVLLAAVSLLVLGCDKESYEILSDIVDNVSDSLYDAGDDTASREDERPRADTLHTDIAAEPSDVEEMCTCQCPCDSHVESADAGSSSLLDTESDSHLEVEPRLSTDTEIVAIDASVPEMPNTESPVETSSCLIISEIVEGSSNNKGIELFNCSDVALDLTGHGICIYSNDNVECGTTFPLSGSVDPQGVVTICHNSADILEPCTFRSGVTNFSGDDRLALFHGETVIDAFGELLTRPEGTPWANVTLRRIEQAPYVGTGPFDTGLYYSTHEIDDYTDFGTSPVF